MNQLNLNRRPGLPVAAPRLAAVIACFVGLTIGRAGSAATINVPSAGITSIQSGINAAVNGDEVVVANGTWMGGGNTNLNFGGRLITLRSASGNPALCIIECQSLQQGFVFNTFESNAAVVDGFTIRNGFAVGLGGGGFQLNNSSPTISNCIIQNCFSNGRAGGIYLSSGSPVITGTTIRACTTNGVGAGLYSTAGNATVTNCTFDDNSAAGNYGGGVYLLNGSAVFTGCIFTLNDSVLGGGAIYALNGPVTVGDSLFLSNQSRHGGAIHVNGAVATVTGSSFTMNTASANATSSTGGAMTLVSSNAKIADCTFTGNLATTTGGASGYGGAVQVTDSSPSFVRCTFDGNTAAASGSSSSEGGAVRNLNGAPVLASCTFSDSVADIGGALMNVASPGLTAINCVIVDSTADFGSGLSNSSSGTSTAINCLFAGNVATLSGGGCLTGNNVVRNSIVWGNTPHQIEPTSTPSVQHSVIQGGYAGTGNLNANPGFLDPAGGDYGIGAGSPCVDAGSNAHLPADALDLDGDLDTTEVLPLDRAGAARVVDGDGDATATVDIGPYEYAVLCVADLDGGGSVGFGDILQVIAAWGPCAGCPQDLSGNGFVDFADILIVIANWGACP